MPREYVVGWIKRGPTGVIGTDKSDAAQTVRHLVEDLLADPNAPAPTLDLDAVLATRTPRPTTMADWQAIDAAEVRRGARRGKPRSKVATWAGCWTCAPTASRPPKRPGNRGRPR